MRIQKYCSLSLHCVHITDCWYHVPIIPYISRLVWSLYKLPFFSKSVPHEDWKTDQTRNKSETKIFNSKTSLLQSSHFTVKTIDGLTIEHISIGWIFFDLLKQWPTDTRYVWLADYYCCLHVALLTTICRLNRESSNVVYG